jgi:hypothetical protein
MAPKGRFIPDNQRCRHMFGPLRRCGRYAEVTNGVVVDGFCWQHRRDVRKVAAAPSQAGGTEL